MKQLDPKKLTAEIKAIYAKKRALAEKMKSPKKTYGDLTDKEREYLHDAGHSPHF